MPIPADWTTVPVTWDLYGHTGNACDGIVVFTASQIVTCDGDTFVPDPIHAAVTNGVMAAVSLPATDDPDITPTGWTWRVTALVTPDGPEPFAIAVPAAGGTINLATVVPVGDGPVFVPLDYVDEAINDLLEDPDSLTRQAFDAALADLAPLDAAEWPVYAYGNSYANNGQTGFGNAPTWFTAGQHYLTRAAADLNLGTVTSYAVNGTRLVNIVDSLRGTAGTPGTNVTPLAGALWPGTSSRSGLVVIDSFFNDVGHYPTHQVAVTPTLIGTANTQYVDGCKDMLRTVLALASTESRVEQSTGTFTGTWANQAAAHDSNSGGTVAVATQNGAAIELTATPPQSGPLAGRVFVLMSKHSTNVGTMATFDVQVDGGAATPHAAPTAWEEYTGAGVGGAAIQSVALVVPVDLPIDNAAHTVKLTHTGSAGHRMNVDAVLVPSVTPNPIAVMGCERPPSVDTWDATKVAAWTANSALLLPLLKAVVEEFPNAFYVPSTVSSTGLYSGDGLHLNDRGQAQRANDLIVACEAIRARFRSRALDASDDFATL